MNRNTCVLLLALLAPASFLFCRINLGAADAPHITSPSDVPQLIKQLGDDNFAIRESATEALKRRPRAISALRAAVQSDDAEVRRRCQEILMELRARQLPLALQKMRRAQHDGRIDLFVEYANVIRKDLEQDQCQIADLVEGVLLTTALETKLIVGLYNRRHEAAP